MKNNSMLISVVTAVAVLSWHLPARAQNLTVDASKVVVVDNSGNDRTTEILRDAANFAFRGAKDNLKGAIETRLGADEDKEKLFIRTALFTDIARGGSVNALCANKTDLSATLTVEYIPFDSDETVHSLKKVVFPVICFDFYAHGSPFIARGYSGPDDLKEVVQPYSVKAVQLNNQERGDGRLGLELNKEQGGCDTELRTYTRTYCTDDAAQEIIGSQSPTNIGVANSGEGNGIVSIARNPTRLNCIDATIHLQGKGEVILFDSQATGRISDCKGHSYALFNLVAYAMKIYRNGGSPPPLR